MGYADKDNAWWKVKKYKVARHIDHLPLYFGDKFTGEYVIYIADLPQDKFEIVTDKTFYHEINFRTQAVTEYEDKIVVSDVIYSKDYINEEYYKYDIDTPYYRYSNKGKRRR